MKILVAYYTVYGHVLTMAKAVEGGAKSVAGSDVVLRRARKFPDTVQNLNKEDGYAKQVYDSQASIQNVRLTIFAPRMV
jgi:NAD(P)H dehydrogenase (quinone)